MEKFMVASSGDTLDSKVSGRFGHAGYFLLVDPQSMDYEVFPGVSTTEGQSISRYIDRTEIKKIIVGNIGPSAYNEIRSYGCKVYLCRNMQVPEAIKKVRDGDVPELKEPTIRESIHSARKTGYNYDGHEEGRRPGKGSGQGFRRSGLSGRRSGSGRNSGSGKRT